MNKPDAAAFLGKSTRQFERLITARRIHSYKIKTDRGQEADFRLSDLERLKRKLAEEAGEEMVEEGEEVPSPLFANNPLAAARRIKIVDQPQETTALATVRQEPSAIVPATSRHESLPDPAKVFATSHRMVLTIEDICIQTPFGRDFVRAAFVAGELKGKKIGRGWCANREDFDAWRVQLME